MEYGSTPQIGLDQKQNGDMCIGTKQLVRITL
jgi:hypothetical protein